MGIIKSNILINEKFNVIYQQYCIQLILKLMNLRVVSVTTLALDGFLFNPQQKVNEMKMNRTFFFGINNEEINASIIFQTDLFNIINISFLYLYFNVLLNISMKNKQYNSIEIIRNNMLPHFPTHNITALCFVVPKK